MSSRKSFERCAVEKLVFDAIAKRIDQVGPGRNQPRGAADGKSVHGRAFSIAVGLLAGETLELGDEHGRRWRASALALEWVLAGEAAPVVEGSAGDVAIEIARRRLEECSPPLATTKS